MKINWFGRTYYGGKNYPDKDGPFRRPFYWAFRAWWDYDVSPWLMKKDYLHQKDGNHIYVYRWQKYVNRYS